MGREDPIMVGYAGIQVQGRRNWVKCEEGLCCEYTDIFPFSSLIIYSLNYFPDIFMIYLFKPYYLEVTDIFLHFSH